MDGWMDGWVGGWMGGGGKTGLRIAYKNQKEPGPASADGRAFASKKFTSTNRESKQPLARIFPCGK